MAEDFGADDRGGFYDEVGTLRDVVQNHLLQVLALVSMDPPIGASADDLRDKKVEALKAVLAADPQHCVRGQYDGYQQVPGVAPGFGHGDVCRACGWRSTAGAGRTCRSSSGQANSCLSATQKCG